MLTIRNDQIDELNQLADRRFESEMVDHLKEFAPELSQILGEPAIRQVIRIGIKRADSYGLTNRGPTRFYIELMFALGSDFDTDPQLPWARSILTNKSIASQISRADILYRAMTSYFNEISGRDNYYAQRALYRISQRWFDEYQDQRGDFESRMLAGLQSVYPEKSSYIGDAILRVLIRQGAALAKARGIDTELGRPLLVGLMFGFGHGVAGDLLYPWVAATLNEHSASGSDRAQRLLKKTKTYVNRMLQNLKVS